MDGNMVCLEALTGRVIWSVSTGSTLLRSSIVQLIPSLNGNLYLYHKGSLEKHPMTVYEIVSKSPFSMNDDLLYIGSKETQIYSIDLETGNLLKCSASEGNPCGEMKGDGRMLVMRSDYLVKAVDRWSGEMKWNVTLGEYSTTSSVGMFVKDSHSQQHQHGLGRDASNDDFGSSPYGEQHQNSKSMHFTPTHGLLSAMDGNLRLIEFATSKTVWTVTLPSPAVHMQNNIHSSLRPDFVIADLKFVPQLLLHLDSTQLREGETRVFVGEHQGNLIAIEQLAQYNHYDSGTREGSTPQLDSQSASIFSFPSSPETTPVGLPSNPSPSSSSPSAESSSSSSSQVVSVNPTTTTTTATNTMTHGLPLYVPKRLCSGPHDTSLDCLLGIHYIQTDPCCVGDNCMCDATLRLPDKPTPRLPDAPRPSQNLSKIHPTFDWDSGDYDGILRAIILFDWYRQQLRTWPVWIQLIAPTLILLLAYYLLYRGGRTKTSSTYSLSSSSSSPSSSSSVMTSVSGSTVVDGKSNGEGFGWTGTSTSVPSSSSPSSQEAGVVRVGKLEVYTTKVLGHGSSGTIVFEGSMSGRRVAVKRMLKTFFSIAEKETHVLTQTDEHPNVIRYYTTEEDADFIYLALSFAERSLANFIEDDSRFQALTDANKRHILHQLAHGMKHLHDINIVHRDIKPQNVLITGNGMVKISDMGLAKKLDSDTLSLSTAAHGTIGWQAPELVIARVSSSNEDSSSRYSGKSSSSASESSSSSSSTTPTSSGAVVRGDDVVDLKGSENVGITTVKRVKVSKRVDIFSLGCLFYYVLTRRHPFGDRLMRESNIVSNQSDVSGVSAEAADLIKKMTSREARTRPTASQVLEHPYFWDANKRLRFLKDSSDFFEFEKPNSETVLRFEYAAEHSAVIPGMNWVSQLPEELLQDLNKFRKYNGAKLRDLLRVIRNKAHHYRDLPPETQQTFGPLPEGFLDYFCLHRFPDLLSFTWNYARTRYAHDKVFSEYFPHGPGYIDEEELVVPLLLPTTASSTTSMTITPPATITTAATVHTATTTTSTATTSAASGPLSPQVNSHHRTQSQHQHSNRPSSTPSTPSEAHHQASSSSSPSSSPARVNSGTKPNHSSYAWSRPSAQVGSSGVGGGGGAGGSGRGNANTSTNWRSKNNPR